MQSPEPPCCSAKGRVCSKEMERLLRGCLEAGVGAQGTSLEGQLKAAAPDPAVRTLDPQAALPLVLTGGHLALPL